jgi:hypothetical protein
MASLYQEDLAWGNEFCKTLSFLFPVVKCPIQKPPQTIRPSSPDTNYISCLSRYGELLTFMGNLTCCNEGQSFNEISNQNALAKAPTGCLVVLRKPFVWDSPPNWSETCAFGQLAIPFILAFQQPSQSKRILKSQNKKSTERMTRGGSSDPHVYIDTIGVSRGVPDKFKDRNQVVAGFK